MTAKQKGGKTQQLEADAVIFAIGVTGISLLQRCLSSARRHRAVRLEIQQSILHPSWMGF